MKIEIDETAFDDAGLIYIRTGNVATFYTPDRPRPRSKSGS